MGASLLLVEDDAGIAAPLIRALEREGYDVTHLASGRDAIDHIAATPPQLVILDLGLPDVDGLDVCRAVREDGFGGSILILTARGDELDRVVGLDSGADDYLAKPFGLAELLARVRSQLRRSPVAATSADEAPGAAPDDVGAGDPGSTDAGPAGDRVQTVGNLRVDPAAHRVWVDDDEVTLTAKEMGLLVLLASEVGAVVTRERIMDEVWDEHWFGSTKTLDVTLGRLRQKLAAADARVVAVRGVGFRLEPPD